MKLIFIFLISFAMCIYTKTTSKKKCIINTNDTSQIDRIYDSLVHSGADSVILFHEVRTNIETEGIFSWKKSDVLFGRRFKASRGKLYVNEKIDFTALLKKGRKLYFLNEQFFPDSVKSSITASHEFWICIKSYTKEGAKTHYLNSNEIVFNKKPTELVKVGRIFHDVLYSN